MRHFVDLTWIDLGGRPRAIRVPAASLDSALASVVVPLAEVAPGAGDELLRLRPDAAASFPSPWSDCVETVICELVDENGQPSPFCSRSVLRRALDEFSQDSVSVVVAAELEFYLYDLETERPVYDQIQLYGIVKAAEFEHVLREVRSLRGYRIPVDGSNPEYAGGQFEANLRHHDALPAIDGATLLRSSVLEIAARHGLGATFMAKPWTDQAGSGMHFHQSLWRDGRNLFFDRGLSANGRAYLAGLLDGMAELTPLGSPTPNAYRRRREGSFVPTAACWGLDNRTVSVRVLAESEHSTRLEQRDAAADCNPYLAIAGQLAAGLAGMVTKAEPPEPVEGNAYELPDLPPLPRSLEVALPAFAGSGLAVRTLGEQLHAHLVTTLRERVEEAQGAVGEWEREEYLRGQ